MKQSTVNTTTTIVMGIIVVCFIGLIIFGALTAEKRQKRNYDIFTEKCQNIGYDEYKYIGMTHYCEKNNTLYKVILEYTNDETKLYIVARPAEVA